MDVFPINVLNTIAQHGLEGISLTHILELYPNYDLESILKGWITDGHVSLEYQTNEKLAEKDRITPFGYVEHKRLSLDKLDHTKDKSLTFVVANVGLRLRYLRCSSFLPTNQFLALEFIGKGGPAGVSRSSINKFIPQVCSVSMANFVVRQLRNLGYVCEHTEDEIPSYENQKLFLSHFIPVEERDYITTGNQRDTSLLYYVEKLEQALLSEPRIDMYKFLLSFSRYKSLSKREKNSLRTRLKRAIISMNPKTILFIEPQFVCLNPNDNLEVEETESLEPAEFFFGTPVNYQFKELVRDSGSEGFEFRKYGVLSRQLDTTGFKKRTRRVQGMKMTCIYYLHPDAPNDSPLPKLKQILLEVNPTAISNEDLDQKLKTLSDDSAYRLIRVVTEMRKIKVGDSVDMYRKLNFSIDRKSRLRDYSFLSSVGVVNPSFELSDTWYLHGISKDDPIIVNYQNNQVEKKTEDFRSISKGKKLFFDSVRRGYRLPIHVRLKALLKSLFATYSERDRLPSSEVVLKRLSNQAYFTAFHSQAVDSENAKLAGDICEKPELWSVNLQKIKHYLSILKRWNIIRRKKLLRFVQLKQENSIRTYDFSSSEERNLYFEKLKTSVNTDRSQWDERLILRHVSRKHLEKLISWKKRRFSSIDEIDFDSFLQRTLSKGIHFKAAVCFLFTFRGKLGSQRKQNRRKVKKKPLSESSSLSLKDSLILTSLVSDFPSDKAIDWKLVSEELCNQSTTTKLNPTQLPRLWEKLFAQTKWIQLAVSKCRMMKKVKDLSYTTFDIVRSIQLGESLPEEIHLLKLPAKQSDWRKYFEETNQEHYDEPFSPPNSLKYISTEKFFTMILFREKKFYHKKIGESEQNKFSIENLRLAKERLLDQGLCTVRDPNSLSASYCNQNILKRYPEDIFDENCLNKVRNTISFLQEFQNYGDFPPFELRINQVYGDDLDFGLHVVSNPTPRFVNTILQLLHEGIIQMASDFSEVNYQSCETITSLFQMLKAITSNESSTTTGEIGCNIEMLYKYEPNPFSPKAGKSLVKNLDPQFLETMVAKSKLIAESHCRDVQIEVLSEPLDSDRKRKRSSVDDQDAPLSQKRRMERDIQDHSSYSPALRPLLSYIEENEGPEAKRLMHTISSVWEEIIDLGEVLSYSLIDRGASRRHKNERNKALSYLEAFGLVFRVHGDLIIPFSSSDCHTFRKVKLHQKRIEEKQLRPPPTVVETEQPQAPISLLEMVDNISETVEVSVPKPKKVRKRVEFLHERIPFDPVLHFTGDINEKMVQDHKHRLLEEILVSPGITHKQLQDKFERFGKTLVNRLLDLLMEEGRILCHQVQLEHSTTFWKSESVTSETYFPVPFH